MSPCVAGAGEVGVLSVVCPPGLSERLVWSCATAFSSEMTELNQVTGLSRADRRAKAINKLWCVVPWRTARLVRVPAGRAAAEAQGLPWASARTLVLSASTWSWNPEVPRGVPVGTRNGRITTKRC